MNRTTLACTSIASLALFGSAMLVAGPIDPPPGVVSPSYKTLAEVEPRIAINTANTPGDADSLFKVTQPGSYYLSGNITGVVGKHGIEIASSGVTLDLMGFDLVGVPSMGSFDGVSVSSPVSNIAVVNGSVRAWGSDGVDLNAATGGRVHHVLASGNSGTGIRVGPGSIVTDCSAFQNSGGGIGGNNADDCTISGCTASDNTGVGIGVVHNGTISGCSAIDNGSHGIVVSTGSIVSDCISNSNSRDGIQFNNDCVIRNNLAFLNGSFSGDGAGIHATSGGNLIEGNNCSGADRGIDVDFGGNIIIGNTCSGNTVNWAIAANNVYGTIVDRATPGGAAVNGNFAPTSLASTDPHVNITY